MKHFDFVTAIQLRDYYKDKLKGLTLTQKIKLPIIDVIACVAGTQQKSIEDGLNLNIDDESIPPEQRLMKVYIVVAYVKDGNVLLIEDLDKILTEKSIQKIYA